MKFLNKIILLAVVLSPIMSFGQYCNGFHNDFCYLSENEMFNINGQSKSALFSKGQTSKLNIIVYKGQDYRISLCMDENLGSQVHFRIFENKKVKVEKIKETKRMEEEMKNCSVCDGSGEFEGSSCHECEGKGQLATGKEIEVIDKETRVVVEKVEEQLYDNADDGFSNEIEFSVESTRRLILEISIPSSGGSGSSKGIKKGKGKLSKSSDMGCVGVLVEHMVTPKSGF